MSGLRVKRLIWTIGFLGVTLTAIVMECVAGLWHPAGWTIPWTEYLARYVPWPVQLTAYVILAVWLPFHFWRHDHLRSVAFKQGYDAALRKNSTQANLGLATTRDMLAELHARGDVEERVGDANAGGFLREHIETLSAELPKVMQDYRTTDGRPATFEPDPAWRVPRGT